MDFSQIWQDPSKRKVLMLSIIAAVLGAMYFYMDSGSTEKKADRKYSTKQGSVFGVTESTNEIGQTDSMKMLDKMSDEFQQREKQLDNREDKLDKVLDALTTDITQSKNELSELKQQIAVLSKLQEKPANADTAGSIYGPQSTKAAVQGENRQMDVMDANGNVLRRQQTQIVTSQEPQIEGTLIRTITQRNVREVRESGKVEEKSIRTTNLSQRNQEVTTDKKKPNKADNNKSVNGGNEGEFTLTMGSIITGVTINGVAAPTSASGSKDPIPVLMRVKKEALMPNYYTLDIRDCTILGSATGDLSSSRAYIRAEAIACITESGQAIEKNITAYAVSSGDGMAGIAGDVVFKSGKMISNALQADFLSNFGQAMSPQRVQSLNTNPGDTALWQNQDLKYAGVAGIAGGFGGATERIANLYAQMAEGTFPVIEIVPGLEIDFIVQKGMTMKLGGDTKSSADNGQTQTTNKAAPR